ncbi:DNA replication protein psf2 [Sporothrix stenoceras]|uniref:DNA replication complex GINS protein PSF2 n=1 Tax=Sporothrix stenoceras TaxID=5173 RepID=A0ABR3ZP74_9PEZI
MASPFPPGLLPAEVAFVCEMEHVTVVPRQRLDSIPLLGGATPQLRPPYRAVLPLWLALLLKRQRRASIIAPPWLHPASLRELVVLETKNLTPEDPAAERDERQQGLQDDDDDDDATRVRFAPPPPPPVRADGAGNARRVNGQRGPRHVDGFVGDPLLGPPIPLSPPFLPSCTADAPAGYLPYHWFEVAEILLAHAPDDLPAPVGEVRALLRDLAEARAAKVRHLATVAAAGTDPSTVTDSADGYNPASKKPSPAIVNLRGIGAMELSEARGLVAAVHDGVRKLGAAAEASRRDEEDLMGSAGAGGRGAPGAYDDDDDDDDEDMIGE